LPKRRIGLLGGSFNPAHEGHVHVSVEALKRLGLDEVWWLVAPQNPLKSVAGMAPLSARLAAAKAFVRHPQIRVLGIEAELGTRYTADTIAALQALYPRQHFVWLMGADNLAQIRHWRRWRSIFARLPIAVFARPTYCRRALAELAAKRFARARIAPPAHRLVRLKPPAWVFLSVKLDPSSATAIRSHGGAQLRRS
jgi:nicotinate-nucleotide adenylyltransferase